MNSFLKYSVLFFKSSSLNFDIIGSSHMINVEAIEHHTKPIWGFQTHIEASWSFAKRQGIEKEVYLETRDFGLKILSNFFKHIEL